MYYLVINGSQQGPYSVEQVRTMMASGEIKSDTMMWTEGQADWQPVARVLGIHPIPPPAPPVQVHSQRAGLFSFFGGIGTALVIVGVILMGLLVAGGGIVGYLIYAGTALDRSSKAYVDEAVPAIVTRWSPDELVKRESKAFQKATNDQQLMKLFVAFRRLGALQAYKGCKGDSKVNFTTDSGKVITAAYLAKATFENGEAEIKVFLIQEDGVWKIQGFRVDSPAFLK